MTTHAPLHPNRRAMLGLLGGASALALGGPALASTGESLQDLAAVLPTLPEVRLYVARRVITMEPGGEGADAVAVVGDRILGSGPRAEVEAWLADQPYVVDETFAGKVIIPGLIDQHVHPVLAALTLTLEIIAIEDWVLPAGTAKAATSPEDYMARLVAAEAALTDPAQPLITWGYHHYFHGTVRRPDLDAISTTRPILIWHRSAHEFVLNTPALELLGVTQEFVDGFSASAKEQSDFEQGHFFEQGGFAVMPKLAPMLATPDRLMAGLAMTRDYLHRSGITLGCEPGGVLSKPLQDAQNAALGGNDVPFRTYYMPDGKSLTALYSGPELIAQTEALLTWGEGRTAFLPKQVKLFADGAIYSQLMQMRDGYTDGHSGEWIMNPDTFNPAFDAYWAAGFQIHIHQNGDLGLDMVLDALERNMRRQPRADHRTTIVHFGYARPDQVDRLAVLGAIVSANPYYVTALSDRYGEVGLGPDRADALVPIGDVVARSVPVALHSDMPMAPAQPLFLVWAAATRATVSGRIAGPEQKLSVEQALRAVTIDAAYTLRMENEIGSIAPGKLANFTILDDDPLTVEVDRIKDIGIWGTVFEGTLFPVAAVDPAKKASLHLRSGTPRPQPLYALAEVAPIATRGGMAGTLACSCCGPSPAMCGPGEVASQTSMGCCSTNALGWAVAAEWAASA